MLLLSPLSKYASLFCLFALQTDSKDGPCSKLIRDSFTEAIKVLQKKGVLFQKSKNPQDMYFVSISLYEWWSVGKACSVTFT